MADAGATAFVGGGSRAGGADNRNETFHAPSPTVFVGGGAAPATSDNRFEKLVQPNADGPVVLVEYFKMRARDQTCPSGQQPAYVYWVVEDFPDDALAFVTVGDLICGSDPLTDLVEVEVAFRWRE